MLQTFQNTYQVTAVSFSDTSEQIMSGGIDNDIKVGSYLFLASDGIQGLVVQN